MNHGIFILILNFDLKQKWNKDCYSIVFIEAVDKKLANRPTLWRSILANLVKFYIFKNDLYLNVFIYF